MLDILGKIGFDWRVALPQLVNFGIILFIIFKLFYRPIRKNLAERQGIISKGLDNAEEAKKALKNAEEQASGHISDARKEANLLVTDARARSDAMVNDATGKASQEAASIIEEAKKRGEAEITKKRGSFSKEAAGAVILAIEKILNNDISPEQKTSLNTQAISALDSALSKSA